MPKVALVYFVALGFLAIAAENSDVTEFPKALQNRKVGTITLTGRTQETTKKYIDEDDEADEEDEVSANIDDSSIRISTTEPSPSSTRLFSSTTNLPNKGRESTTQNGSGGERRNKDEVSANIDESSIAISTTEPSPSTTRLFSSTTNLPNKGTESTTRNGGGGKRRNKNKNSRKRNNRNNSPVTKSTREPKAIVFSENEENNKRAEKISNDPDYNFDADDVTEVSTEKPDSRDNEPTATDSKVVCSSPPEIEGSISPVLDGTEHSEGTTIWYQCPLGHVSRSSSSLMSVCQFNKTTGKGEWTHPDISCIPRSCGDPGYVPNGRRIGNLLTFPNKVEFICQEGYKLRGIKSRYCQAGGEWSGRLPTCEQIYCPSPSDPENGRVSFSSLSYGSELEYRCNDGYMLQNHQTRYCSEDGKWSGTDPECVETACEKPEKPLHGSVHLSGELKPGSLALFSCDQGTTLYGTSRNRCLPSGSWIFDHPKCFRVCKVPNIQNGELGSFEEVRDYRQRISRRFVRIYADEQVEHNKTMVLRCREGFLPGIDAANETDEVMCIDGTWSKPMQCQEFLCSGEAPPLEHASPRIISRKHKATIWYQCNDGYEKVKSGNVTCRYGKWDGTPPVCADFRCYLNQLDYPGLVKPAQEFLDNRRGFDIECEEAYKKDSWKTRIFCSRGQWDVEKNPCKIRMCDDDPPSPHKGRPKEFTRHHGSTVDYECDENFQISGQSSVYCELGKWVGQTPACVRSVLHLKQNASSSSKFGYTTETSREPSSGTPPSERLDNCFCTYNYRTDLLGAFVQNRKLTDGGAVKKGTTVEFRCLYHGTDIVWPNGFRMQGSIYLTCTTCQVWEEQDLPYCEPRQSGDAFIIYNRTMKFLPGGIIEVKKLEPVKLFCDSVWGQPLWNAGQRKGIQFFQNTAESIQRTGKYVAIMIIHQMREEYSGRYQCTFMDYYGTAYRSATVDLQISAPEIQCTDLRTNTDRGRFNIYYQNERRVNSTAQYKCADSSMYELGENVRTCMANGKWSGTYPQCTDIRCSHLSEENLLITYTNDRKINSDAVFTCKSNAQRLIGTDRRTCQQNGQWSGQDPSCEDITCSEFPRYNRLSISYTNGFKINSVATFTCEPPTELVGSSSSQCQDDGKWSHPKPSCELMEFHCPKIEGGETFTVKYSDNTTRRINSTAVLFCKAQFQKIEGCNILTCQQNGEWSGEFPTCVDYVVCEKFDSLPYLEVSYSDGVRVGSTARFNCLDGTTRVGATYATCRNDGKWTYESPTCKAARCSIYDLQESLPKEVYPVMNEGTEEYVDSSSELGLQCENLPKRQLILTGSSKATCTNGKWEFGNVQCIPGCVLKADLSPHLIIEPTENHYRLGDSIILSCIDGYKLSSDIQKVMCLGSTWSDDFPNCVHNAN